MAEATATRNTYRQSPRKVRVVANYFKGKPLARAIMEADFVTKRAAWPVKKLLESAKSNAIGKGMSTDSLMVKNITVNEGPIMYRRSIRAQGAAYRIRKRTCHITVTLEEMTPKLASVQKSPTAQKTTKKPATQKTVAKKAAPKKTATKK